MSRSTRLLLNSIWNTTAAVVAGVLAFMLVPFMLTHLGQEEYGVWVIIGSMFAYSTVFHFGLSSAINRYVPVGLARGDDDAIRRVASTGTVFFAGVGLAVALFTGLIYFNFTRWFNIPPELVPKAEQAVLAVGILLSITVMMQTFGAVLTGYQRYDLTAGSRIGLLLLRAAAIVTVLFQGRGVVAVAIVYGLTELGINIAHLFFAKRLMPARAVSLAAFDPRLLREMMTYGLNTFLYGTGAVIAYKASELVIGAFMQAGDVARYSVAAAGVLTVSTLIDSLSAAIKPAVSDMDARDESDRIRVLALKSQKYTLFLIVPSVAFLVLMGREFLQVWTGLTDPELPIILTLLTLGQAFRLSQHSNFLVLVGKGEHRFFGFAVLGIGVSVVTLSTLAASVFHLGLIGIACASLISWAVVCGIAMPIHVNNRLGISWRDRWEAVIKPVALTGFPAAVILFAWKKLLPPSSWVAILTVVFVTAIVTAISAWHLALDESERHRFSGLLRFKRPVPSST